PAYSTAAPQPPPPEPATASGKIVAAAEAARVEPQGDEVRARLLDKVGALSADALTRAEAYIDSLLLEGGAGPSLSAEGADPFSPPCATQHDGEVGSPPPGAAPTRGAWDKDVTLRVQRDGHLPLKPAGEWKPPPGGREKYDTDYLITRM